MTTFLYDPIANTFFPDFGMKQKKPLTNFKAIPEKGEKVFFFLFKFNTKARCPIERNFLRA